MAKAQKTQNVVDVQLDVSKLVPYAKNARLHSEAQVAKIAKSIAKFGFTNPVLIWKKNEIVAGHGRVLAVNLLLEQDPEKYAHLRTLPCRKLDYLTDAERKAYVLADNKLALDATWDDVLLNEELSELHAEDFDMSLTGFDADELPDFDAEGNPGSNSSGSAGTMGSLSDKFLVPPFSVLNAREGWWQDRKRAWLALGIKSEVGRGDNLLKFSEQAKLGGKGYDKPKGKKATAIPGGGTGKNSAYMFKKPEGGYESLKSMQEKSGLAKNMNTAAWVKEKGLQGLSADVAEGSGTSVFDPVLCELAYTWFSPKNGTILDPFAGGSVRGIVASKLKRHYFGIDLRPEQIDANREQAKTVCKGSKHVPEWRTGDSLNINSIAKNVKADMVFSCPPYADLEVYSDLEQDLSTMEYKKFREVYFEIIKRACAQLKDDRFACFVVGDVRDKKTGAYYDFVGDTVQAFRDAGLEYHNEIILVTSVGSLPIRAGKQFQATRRVGKTHQNVLVFCKGDPRKAVKACGDVEVHIPDNPDGPVKAPVEADKYGELME